RIDMSHEPFLAKLVALVPPPNLHLVRYGGVIANAHHLRCAIAPKPQHPNPAPSSHVPLLDFKGKPRSIASTDLEPPKPKRIAWAKLLAHVFAPVLRPHLLRPDNSSSPSLIDRESVDLVVRRRFSFDP